MGKIGRNQPCPCGSGRKYKHCCLPAQQAGTAGQPDQSDEVSLMAAIEKTQGLAVEKKVTFQELGVFLFFSDHEGDAWLLEITESDAVQIAKGGERLDVPIDENPETIEINFSHTFTLRDRQFFLTAYADKAETRLDKRPPSRFTPLSGGCISATLRKCLNGCMWRGAATGPRARVL